MRPTDVREQSVCCRVSKRKTFIHFSFHTDRSKLLTPIYFLYLLYLLDLLALLFDPDLRDLHISH